MKHCKGGGLPDGLQAVSAEPVERNHHQAVQQSLNCWCVCVCVCVCVNGDIAYLRISEWQFASIQ